MAQFVQVGNHAINVDTITDVIFQSKGQEHMVQIWRTTGSEECHEWHGAHCDAFRKWWKNHAEVYRCP